MRHQFQWSHQLESNLLVFQFHDGVRWHILDDELLEAFLAPFLGVEKFLGGEPRRFFDGNLGGRIRRVVSGSRAWRYRERSCCWRAGELVEACIVKDDVGMSSGASTQSGGDGLGCGDQAFAELDVISVVYDSFLMGVVSSLAMIVLYAAERVTVALVDIVVVPTLLILVVFASNLIDSLLNSGKGLYNDKVNQLMSFIYW